MSERVLVVSPEALFPSNAGGRVAVLAQCRALRRAGFAVDLLVFHRQPMSPADARRHEEVAEHVRYVRRRGLIAATLAAPTAPYQVSGRRLRATDVAALEAGPRPDLVVAQQEWTVEAASRLWRHRPVPVLLSSHNDEVAYYTDQLRASTGARRLYLRLERARLKRAVVRALERASAVVALTAADANAYGARAVSVIPHPLPERVAGHRPATDGTTLFVGALDMPHAVQGLLWFVDQVWPQVLERAPGTLFEIVGRRSSTNLAASLAGRAGVRLLGEVDDLEPLYSRAACFVNPVFSGSGVNIKLAEPIGRGIPSVATPIGARGYEALGDALAVAGTPEDFADACVRLLLEPEVALRVGRALLDRADGMRPDAVAAAWATAARSAMAVTSV